MPFPAGVLPTQKKKGKDEMIEILVGLFVKVLMVVLVLYILHGVFLDSGRFWLHVTAAAAMSMIVGFHVANDLDMTSGVVVGVVLFIVFLAFLAGSRKKSR